MKLTDSLIQNVYSTARRIKREIRPGCGCTHDDIAQNALIILLKMKDPDAGVHSEGGLAFRAVKYSILQTGRYKKARMEDCEPEVFTSVFDHRNFWELEVDLRIDGEHLTPKQLKEVYCG